MTKILVTRPEPAASRTALALSKHGHTTVKCPIFEVSDTGKPVPESGYDGVVFTSRNAVDVLLGRGWMVPNPAVPVFCTGENTAKAAAGLGFRDIRTGGGTAKLLANLIANSVLPPNSRLLYPAASDRTFDFALALKPHELMVETLEIYKVGKLSPTKQELAQAFLQAAGGAALVYSARGGSHLSDLIALHNLESSLSTLTCVTISNAVTNSINGYSWRKILTAPSPDEAAMINLASSVL